MKLVGHLFNSINAKSTFNFFPCVTAKGFRGYPLKSWSNPNLLDDIDISSEWGVFMLKGTMCIGFACNIVPFSINSSNCGSVAIQVRVARPHLG